MLNYNQALPDQKSFQDLQMKEIKPIMKLIVRGKKREFISAVGKSLNIFLPTEANTATQSDKKNDKRHKKLPIQYRSKPINEAY